MEGTFNKTFCFLPLFPLRMNFVVLRIGLCPWWGLFFRRRDFFFFWIGPGIYRMTFAVNQNWTCYFLEGICSENWTSCLNKRTRCFVDWIMWHPTEDLSAKKPQKNPLNVIYIHKNGANSNVPSSKYYKLSFIRSFLIFIDLHYIF